MNEIKNMVRLTWNALEDKKGEDIKVVHVSDVSVIADYFNVDLVDLFKKS